MKISETFNQSGLSIFLNSAGGRVFRIVAGLGFIAAGIMYREHLLGVISILWGLLPLSAGMFDICYISFALGGPLSGKKIRSNN